jgi:hypothetical protein
MVGWCGFGGGLCALKVIAKRVPSGSRFFIVCGLCGGVAGVRWALENGLGGKLMMLTK